MRNQEGIKIELQKKMGKKNLYEGHHFFDCMSSFLYHFCRFLHVLPFPSDLLAEWPPKKIHNIAICGILCVAKNMKVSCNLIVTG